ncbi:MAG: hypothetical protein N2515_05935 [Deltaproteobacteria bacterium]|nr:hypothetical protein [Deltaproteobacteria bacterium]
MAQRASEASGTKEAFFAFLASLALHGLVLYSALRVAPAGQGRKQALETQSVAIEVWEEMEEEQREGMISEREEGLAEAHGEGAPPRHEVLKGVSRRGDGGALKLEATQVEGVQGETEPEAEPKAAEATPEGGRQKEPSHAIIDTRRVALNWVLLGAEGPSQPSERAGVEVVAGRLEATRAEEASQHLEEHLRKVASERPWLSRSEPVLLPQPDGSYLYRGHSFTARIAKDGSVQFSDRAAIEGHEMLQGGPARFDIAEWAMRGAGQDPHAAERSWFLERTEALRARLERESREKEREGALQSLAGRLAALWGQDRPAFLKRRALFRIWDECEEEGDGLKARNLVIQFIRTHLPKGGPDAYTDEEIRRLNTERSSRAEFKPYE